MDKRTFLRQSVILAAGTPLLSLACSQTAKQETASSDDTSTDNSAAVALPYLDTIGLQLWTVRDQLDADPVLTLKTLKEIGYKQVEPTRTTKLKELLPICQDLGLEVKSSHITWTTITGRWDLEPDLTPFAFEDILENATSADLSHLVLAYLHSQERENLDAYRLLADQLNEAGVKAKSAGIKLAYHNHNFEFLKMEDSTPMEVLIERLDPELVTFELDVFWAAIAGYDPVDFLERIKDRTSLLHLKDLKPATPVFTNTDDVPKDAFQELGDGTVPIKKLMQMGQEFGVDYCFVEQDQSPDPLASTKQSFDWLHA